MHKIDLGNGLKIFDDYYLLIEKSKVMVIADLHMGYEGVMQNQGIFFPRYQKRIILQRLDKIIKQQKPKEIIINGDLKHEFGKNLRQEWKEIEEILQFLTSKVEVSVVRGNHDNFLKTILSRYDIELKMCFERDGMILVHGHKEIEVEKCESLIIGHEHPSLKLRDDVGAVINLPCFLFHPERNIVVLPAFSPLAMGTDVLQANNEDFLSPILRKIGCDDFKAYAISESVIMDFKRIRDIKKARI